LSRLFQTKKINIFEEIIAERANLL